MQPISRIHVQQQPSTTLRRRWLQCLGLVFVPELVIFTCTLTMFSSTIAFCSIATAVSLIFFECCLCKAQRFLCMRTSYVVMTFVAGAFPLVSVVDLLCSRRDNLKSFVCLILILPPLAYTGCCFCIVCRFCYSVLVCPLKDPLSLLNILTYDLSFHFKPNVCLDSSLCCSFCGKSQAAGSEELRRVVAKDPSSDMDIIFHQNCLQSSLRQCGGLLKFFQHFGMRSVNLCYVEPEGVNAEILVPTITIPSWEQVALAACCFTPEPAENTADKKEGFIYTEDHEIHVYDAEAKTDQVIEYDDELAEVFQDWFLQCVRVGDAVYYKKWKDIGAYYKHNLVTGTERRTNFTLFTARVFQNRYLVGLTKDGGLGVVDLMDEEAGVRVAKSSCSQLAAVIGDVAKCDKYFIEEVAPGELDVRGTRWKICGGYLVEL